MAPRQIPLREPPPCPDCGNPVVWLGNDALLLNLHRREGVWALRRALRPDMHIIPTAVTVGVSPKVLRNRRTVELITALAPRTHLWVEAVAERYDEVSLDNEGLAVLGAIEGIDGIVVGTRAAVTPAALSEFFRKQPSLRVVRARSPAVTDDVLATIGTLADLRLLDVSGTSVTDAGLGSLVSLGRLESLDLSRTAVSDRGLAPLASLGALRTLRLETDKEAPESEFSAEGLAALAKLQHFVALSLRGHSVYKWDTLPVLPHLHTLDLSKTKGIRDLEFIARFAGLQRLDLSYSDVGALDALRTLSELQELDLKNAYTGDLEPLGELKRLRRLNIVDTNAVLSDLAPLERLPHLETVIVNGNIGCPEGTTLPLTCDDLEARTW